MAHEPTVVTIFDHPFRIASTTSEPEAVQEAAGYLDQRMREVAKALRRRVPHEVAILAALEIADEVLQERGRREQLLSEADERISGFTRRLEGGTSGESLAGDPPTPRF